MYKCKKIIIYFFSLITFNFQINLLKPRIFINIWMNDSSFSIWIHTEDEERDRTWDLPTMVDHSYTKLFIKNK